MLDDRDAGLAVSGNRVILTSFNNTVDMQRKWNTDKAQAAYFSAREEYVETYLDKVEKTDAEEKYLGSVYAVSEDGGYTFGPIRQVPVTAPHGPSVANDGRFFYVGRVFSAPNVTDEPSVHCYFMDDNGEFVLTGKIPAIPGEPTIYHCEPHAIMLPDGKILVHIRMERWGGTTPEERLFTIYQSESVDGGKTFTVPHPILPRMGGAPAHLLRLRDGRILSLYGYRAKPYGIRAMISSDGGETWDTDNVVYADGVNGDLGYPASVELENGDILTIFYTHPAEGTSAEIFQMIWRINE
jgi:hypothetical protein